MSTPTLNDFCLGVFSSGSARVDRDSWRASERVCQETQLVLEDLEATYRLWLPGTPPPVSPSPMVWAARVIAWASGVLLDRDQGETTLPEALASAAPDPQNASDVYSVDLMMRFLPSLFNWTRRVDPDDPLTVALLQLSGDWPLSSVGVALEEARGIDTGAIDAINGNDCLRQMYADRIIAKKDLARASNARVADAIRDAIGDYPQLATGLGRLWAVQDDVPAAAQGDDVSLQGDNQ